MVFCKKCGGVVPNDSAFCNRCGEPVAGRNNQRQQVYEGNMHKCPNCGEIVGSFVARCSYCNFEFRGTSASDTINSFIETVNSFDYPPYDQNSYSTYQNKANYIRNFIIPNTKEDIFEFIILASTNIDYDALGNANNSPLLSGKKEVAVAWQSKLHQAYEKARMSFGSAPDFRRIEEIYNNDIKKTKNNKRISGSKKIIPIIIAIAIPLFLIMSLKSCYNSSVKEEREEKIQAELEEKKEKQEAITSLENTVSEIQAAIDAKDYNEAISKANTLVPDSNLDAAEKAKWVKQKKYWLKVISERQAGNTDEIPENYTIKMSESSKDFKGDNFKDVKKRLETAGFYEVKTEKLEDIVTGFITDEGEVEKVSIDGVNEFKKGDTFTAEAEVVVTYHTKKGD